MYSLYIGIQHIVIAIGDFVQIDKIDNISDRIDVTAEEPGGMKLIGKANKLILSDGHTQCIALDFGGLLQVYQRSISIRPGCKVCASILPLSVNMQRLPHVLASQTMIRSPLKTLLYDEEHLYLILIVAVSSVAA